jgi:hypothetical protein
MRIIEQAKVESKEWKDRLATLPTVGSEAKTVVDKYNMVEVIGKANDELVR